MRAIIPLVVVGNLGFMYVVGVGMKAIIDSLGLPLGAPLAVLAVISGVASLAVLVDSREKMARDMLDRIERKHRVNLWDERARLSR